MSYEIYNEFRSLPEFSQSYKFQPWMNSGREGLGVSFSESGKQLFARYKWHGPILYNLHDKYPICCFGDVQKSFCDSGVVSSCSFMEQDRV